jgi:hypothetical protein
MLMGSLVPWMVRTDPPVAAVVKLVAASVAESAAVSAAAETTASRAGATHKDRIFSQIE